MIVYVVTYEPYHDNSTVLGVYTSLAAIASAFPKHTFVTEGSYVGTWPNCVAECIDTKHDCEYLVFAHPLLTG